MTYETILYEPEPPLAFITLNRPEAMNGRRTPVPELSRRFVR
jgi:enoyl-CoA hydratase/carnithine racemase